MINRFKIFISAIIIIWSYNFDLLPDSKYSYSPAKFEIYDLNIFPNVISENAENGDFLEIDIHSEFYEEKGLVKYTLADDANGIFTITSETGEVYVKDASKIDYERSPQHFICVRAELESGFAKRINLKIDVENTHSVNGGDTDNKIRNLEDLDNKENSLNLKSVKGDYVNISAVATDIDGDLITYTLVESSDGRFKIDEMLGMVYLKDDSDLKEGSSYKIKIRATSADKSYVEKEFVIAVVNRTELDREDTDGDGVYNYNDNDSDNDGISNLQENHGEDPFLIDSTIRDTDGDNIPDYLDTDSDNDGVSDKMEGYNDVDSNNIYDYVDPNFSIYSE